MCKFVDYTNSSIATFCTFDYILGVENIYRHINCDMLLNVLQVGSRYYDIFI